MLPDISKGGGKVGEDIGFRILKDPLAKAVSTDGTADVADEHKYGGVVFMLQAGEDGILEFAGRIKITPRFHFVNVGNNEVAEGIVGIVPVDEGKIIFVSTKAVYFFDFGEKLSFNVRQFCQFFHFGNIFRIWVLQVLLFREFM